MNKTYLLLTVLPLFIWSCQKTTPDQSQNSIPSAETTKIERPSTAETQKNLEELAMSYAIETQTELGKNLMGTIQKQGTLAAVEFCNKAAYPLTDSIAIANNVVIRRLSDQPRNPKNTANSSEIEYITQFKNQIAEGIEVEPIIENNEHHINFYYPIRTNAACLQCHGKVGEQITTEVYKNIKELYPSDLAVNYDINQVRGIWSIILAK